MGSHSHLGSLLFGCMILSCGCLSQVKQTEDINFKNFCGALPELKLPLRLHCDLSESKGRDDYAQFSQFIPKNFDRVAGLVKRGEFILILYGIVGDSIYPYLFVYDKKGHVLDTLNLLLMACVADDRVNHHSYATIESNSTISQLDSTWHYYEASDSRRRDSLIVTKVTRRLSKIGRFVKSDSTSKAIKVW